MTHLLDTDTCINLLRGQAGAIAGATKQSPDDLAISAITRYELLYGVERCPPEWKKKEWRKVLALLDQFHLLPFTGETADHAATLRASLESTGKPIGPMDLLIAATALEHGLPLVTSKVKEFRRVPGLLTISWS